ncbi:M48 family metallopeptidase [Myxococcota bacterium]|nr:M48 family metallopeptidase [Myxococcota bacterium]MBU1379614.1 M48 family metallopeptidase [Myxococcota bacterium]MBU1496311.1 M48 family metallopeptidase [Myxococcota bacterium]
MTPEQIKDIKKFIKEIREKETPNFNFFPETKRALLRTNLSVAFLLIIYILLIAACSVGVVVHLLNNTFMMKTGPWGFIAYFTIAVGLVFGLIIFTRPFFVKFTLDEGEMQLKRKDAPEFFAMIEAVSNYVGVSSPTKIFLNFNSYFAVQGMPGIWKKEHEYYLQIGFPSLVHMEVSNLAGILAHELGHQKIREKLGIQNFNEVVISWFKYFSREDDPIYRFFHNSLYIFLLLIPYLMLLIVRKVMKLLHYFAFRASMDLSRQIEFKADRYEHNLSGPEVFALSFDKVEKSELFHHKAIAVAKELNLQENIIIRDFSNLVKAMPDLMNEKSVDYLHEKLRNRKIKVLETHPSTVERIEVARKCAYGGHLSGTWEAKLMFADFDAIDDKLTRNNRDSIAPFHRKNSTYVLTTEILDDLKKVNEYQLAFLRVFQCSFNQRISLRRGKLLSESILPSLSTSDVIKMQLEHRENTENSIYRFMKKFMKVNLKEVEIELIDSGYIIKEKNGVFDRMATDVHKEIIAIYNQIDSLDRKANKFYKLGLRRVYNALNSISVSDERHKAMTDILENLRKLYSINEKLYKIWVLNLKLTANAPVIFCNCDGSRWIFYIKKFEHEFHRVFLKTLKEFNDFNLVPTKYTTNIKTNIPLIHKGNISDALDKAQRFFTIYNSLLQRNFYELAAICEEVEIEKGMKKLADPLPLADAIVLEVSESIK